MEKAAGELRHARSGIHGSMATLITGWAQTAIILCLLLLLLDGVGLASMPQSGSGRTSGLYPLGTPLSAGPEQFEDHCDRIPDDLNCWPLCTDNCSQECSVEAYADLPWYWPPDQDPLVFFSVPKFNQQEHDCDRLVQVMVWFEVNINARWWLANTSSQVCCLDFLWYKPQFQLDLGPDNHVDGPPGDGHGYNVPPIEGFPAQSFLWSPAGGSDQQSFYFGRWDPAIPFDWGLGVLNFPDDVDDPADPDGLRYWPPPQESFPCTAEHDNRGYHYHTYSDDFTEDCAPVEALTSDVIIISDPDELAPWIYDGTNPAHRDSVQFGALGLFLTSHFSNCGTPFIYYFARAQSVMHVRYVYVENQPPCCVDPGLPPVCEGSSGIEIDLLQHVTDVDDNIDCSTFALLSEVTTLGGTVVMLGSCDGECTECKVLYTPPTGLPINQSCNPVDLFFFTVQDDCGESVTCDCPDGTNCGDCPENYCVVCVEILPVNHPPVAVDDYEETCEGVPVTIPVCANDTDPDNEGGCGCPLDCAVAEVGDIEITQGPICVDGPFCSGGCEPPPELTVLAGGRVRFDPRSCCAGTWRFWYRIKDQCPEDDDDCLEELWSNEARVTVCVEPVNQPPVAVADEARVCAGDTKDISVCANDWDPDNLDCCGCPLDCASLASTDIEIRNVTCGTAQALVGGDVQFTAPADFCGKCCFEYRVRDNCSGVICSDTVYNCPNIVCHDRLWSEWTPVCVYVDGPNHPPIAVDDCACTCEEEPVVVDVCANDSDEDSCGVPCDGPPQCEDVCEGVCYCGCPLVCEALVKDESIFIWDDGNWDPQNPPHHLGGGLVGGTPKENFCGAALFWYTVWDKCCDGYTCDGPLELESNVATVCVEVCPVNDEPDARPDQAQTPINTPICIDVLANDSDVDEINGCGCGIDRFSTDTIEILDWNDDWGTAEVVNCLASGEVAILYTPALDFEDTFEFDYRLCDTCEGLEACPGNPCELLDCPDADCGCPLVQLCDETTVTVTVGGCPRCREPASLLVYPEYYNDGGVITILSITNVYRGDGPVDDIDVKFEYVDKDTCGAFDRQETLTPNDTLTLVTSVHSPEKTRGYVYAYAVCDDTSEPVVFNHLIGSLMIVDGIEALSYSVNPFCHLGIGVPGMYASCGLLLTDVDGDGIRDLDEIEYDPVADQMLIPRFLAQTEAWRSELILIGASGGSKFTTIADLSIYNDNQEAFSAEHEFYCWTRVPLLEVSQTFGKPFLIGTNDDPFEILGAPQEEAGWFRVDGAVAFSTSHTITDPAIYAVLIESTGATHYVADLPFEFWCQENGKLLPSDLCGNEECDD